MNTDKTILRKRLDELEDDIHKSWLKDLDKVKEISEISDILKQILEKDSIESFFENESDFDYFIKKFSHEVIHNILRQFNVIGANGDDIAFELLLNYVKIFLKFLEKPAYLPLWESVKEIFDPLKSYYRSAQYSNNRNLNEKKLINADKYNELLPKKRNTEVNLVEGGEVDVQIDLRKSYNPNQDKKVWVRGKVHKITENMVQILTSDDPVPITFGKGSFDFTSAGTMTSDYDWRINLKPGDMVDGYDRAKWHPSTILSVKNEMVNGLPKIDLRIGFRVYTKSCENWADYRRIWPEKNLSKDSNGEEFYGDSENMDETLPYYTRRIAKLNSMNSSDYKQENNEYDSYLFDEYIIYNQDNVKNYIVGRNNNFSYYYSQLIIEFIKIGGVDKIISLMGRKERPSVECVYLISIVFNSFYTLFHKEYIKEISEELKTNFINYLSDLSEKEIRSVKKDTIDNILKILKTILGLTIGIEERNKLLEKINITFSTKMLKTTFLEKRIQAVKSLIDIIRSSKNDPTKNEFILKLIEESQIFYEIYGPNSHIQLINRSKDLLEIMIQEDKLSDGEMELIWSATKRGDLEGKLTILKTFKEISKSLKPKHIKTLLENIYSSTGHDLINEEIDLIYELSTHNSQSQETVEKCIKFFTQSLLASKNDDGDKITILINKIFDITKIHGEFKSNVIIMCLESLKRNENIILCLKILTKFIKETNVDQDELLKNLLFQQNSIVQLYCKNFTDYNTKIKGIVKNWNQDIDSIPLDNFTHSQNLKARLNFINTLLSNKLWLESENEPIDFLYDILIENANSEKDKLEFFKWIKRTIENKVESETEGKIFKLFNDKICKDVKSCQNLSIHAFDSYLRVFLNVNQSAGKLSYFQTENKKQQKGNQYSILVSVDPEELIGFDILWKIIFDSFSNEIMNKGIETLHILYTNIKMNESKNTDLSQKLLKKCISLIQQQIKSNISNEEKHNVIMKCLKILRLMIEESEKKGTARVKSHSGLLKHKVITLKVLDSTEKQSEFYIKVYGNTTMWDLKEILAKKVGVCVDFIKITIHKNDIENTDHGRTVIDMKLNENDVIKVQRNTLDSLIPQVELVMNNEVVPECLKIFSDWYDYYSTEGKMTREDCARFVKGVTGSRDDISIDDPRIKGLFDTYDTNKDGLLEKEDFVGFYRECALRPDKKRVVWDNMKTMGIRNDLKRLDEPYELYNTDKTLLPRYNLAHNEELFQTIFSLQDLDESIAKEASNFLYLITTNPNIYRQILFGIVETESVDWEKQLDSKNIYKLIYALQIIESFLEDIEIDSNNVDSFSNEECILDSNQTIEELKKKKILWMEYFVLKGGFSHLVNILNEKLRDYVLLLGKEEPSLMTKISIIFLLKIVRIFYFSSLNKFEVYREINNNEFKSSTKLQKEDIDLTKRKSASFEIGELECLFSGKIGEEIYNSLNYEYLFNIFVETLLKLINNNDTSSEAINTIETSFEFLTGILGFAKNIEEIESKLTGEKENDFEKIVFYGILSDNISIRTIFSRSMIKLTKISNLQRRFNMLSFIFSFIFKFISNLNSEQEKCSSELFEFFSFLFEIYLSNTNEFESRLKDKSQNPREFFMKLVKTLNDDIDLDNSTPLSNELFIGYMKIITKVCMSVNEIKNEISSKYNLLEGIMTKVLFKQSTSNEMNEKLARLEFINPDKFDDSKTKRNSNITIRNECYNFILSLLHGSIQNFEKFFSVNLLDTSKEDKKKEVTKYSLANSHKCEGYVGIRNLQCICYMNSMLQQFFMVPAFRYNLLQVTDGIAPDMNNYHNVDDNFLHQVQRMFSFLELSERQDYNPHGFCFSFKDWEGNPTDVKIQQDSQEFLNRFFDKVDEGIKPTKFKYLLSSTFGGKTCSQIICENGCGNVKNRFEDFYNLSLEVNNMKNVNDSLEKFISPERIDDFKCETCNKKVTITKKNSLAELPNVLIIHLQRIFFNYEIDKNEKINSRLEFPRVLNLKQYTIEDMTRRAVAKKNKESTEETNFENFETDEIYFKHNSYYEYNLVGVVVHLGSADAGHYYSYINTIRNGNDMEMVFNKDDESHMNSWLEFNDSRISKFNVGKMDDECFGGSESSESNENSWGMKNEKIKSAYMLVYERKIKNPIKMKVDENEISDKNNVISFKENETFSIKKANDLFRFIDTPVFSEIYKRVTSSFFYDSAKNEYFQYKPYYNTERIIPKTYYLEVSDDNSLFQKHQNISDEQFVTFFDSVLSVLDDTLSNTQNISEETSTKIASTFMNFIFKILSQKDKNKLLKTAKEKFLHILNLSPNSLTAVFKYLNDNMKLLNDVLLNENSNIVQNHSELLFELIKKGYELNKEEFKNSFLNKSLTSNKLSDIIVRILDLTISFFPRVPGRFVSKIAPLLQFFRNLSTLGSEMIEYLVRNEVIFLFITYILGRDSPYYEETKIRGDNWDIARSNMEGVEHLIQLIYTIFQKSDKYVSFSGPSPLSIYKLSERDFNCLRHPSFLKFVYKYFDNIFSNLLTILSYNNKEYTIKVCSEITKYIDDISPYDDTEITKLFNTLTPLFNLNDKFQLMRFEFLLGFPTINIEEGSIKYPYPFFGFHKIGEENGKIYQYRSLINNRRSSCLLRKLLSLKIRERTPCEFFISLIEASLDNSSLLKYISLLLAEEPLNFNFFNWGNNLIQKYHTKYENLPNFTEKMAKLNPIIDEKLNIVLKEPNVLPEFVGFGKRNYLHGDIQQEIVSLIFTSENLYLYKIEYITSISEFSSHMDFTKSKSYVSGTSILEEDKKDNNGVNNDSDLRPTRIECPEGCNMIDMDSKPISEKDFFRNYNHILENKKKLIVFNNRDVVENPVPSLIRYVIFNNSNREANITLSIIRKPNSIVNEYLPSGPIITQVSGNVTISLYTFHKFDPNLPWSDYDIEVKNEWSNPYNNNPYYNNKSNFTISISKDPRFGAVSSAENIVDGNEDENSESVEENANI